MSMQVTVKYSDVYRALEPLRGLKLRGSVHGPPTSRFPLRELVDNALSTSILGVEEYRSSRIVGVRITPVLHLLCHFGLEEPDDFCVAVEGDNPWKRVTDAALQLSKLTRESYTVILSAIVHAIEGVVSAEEEEVEEISDPDQVIEELLTWLPEYITVVD
jgi:hypothetical protein